MKQLMTERSRMPLKSRKAPAPASQAVRQMPVGRSRSSMVTTLLQQSATLKLPALNRSVLQEFWIPAIFTGVLLFCLIQLGMSIYQTHGAQPVKKLQAISAFAS